MPSPTRSPLFHVYRVTRNRCVLRRADGVEHTYWSPLDGGYVYEVTDARPGTLGAQVCYGLAGSGSTLRCDEGDCLATLIRREARTAAGRRNIAARMDAALEEQEWTGGPAYLTPDLRIINSEQARALGLGGVE
jgi:hypothetical protein